MKYKQIDTYIQRWSIRLLLPITLFLLLGLLPGCDPRGQVYKKPVLLSGNGTTAYRIVLADHAKPYEQTAAQQLGLYLKEITGADFPVVKEGAAPFTGPVISVGLTKSFAKAFAEIDMAKLKPDSIVMKTQGPNIYLAGEGTRGTLYAVNSFLEDQCGVRWWKPFEETVPSKSELSVGLLDTIFQPPFHYRDTNSQIFTSTVLQTQHLKNTKGQEERLRFSARCKNNGLAIGAIPEAWGGSLSMIPFDQNHPDLRSFQDSNHFINIDEFGKTHPEWFCEINGKRQFGALHLAQLCLSNEEMRAEYLRRATNWIDGIPNCRNFVIMHNDNEYYCQCAKCAAVDAEEGSPMGSQMRFLNFMAEKLEEHRPGIQLWMDAYNYTTKPPKITRPRANLGIILCTPIMSHRLSQDSDFMRKWDAWKPIAPKVMIWDYTVNFGNLVNPWPNLRHLGPNIKTLAANGASGVFEQGNTFNSVSDCDELKAWVISHMLWDPSRDPDALIADFVNGYYGVAAKAIMAYLDHIVACGDEVKDGLKGVEQWLDLAAMNTATQFLDEARTKAGNDPVLEERVARIRLTLDYQWLLNWRQYREQADRTGKPFLGPESALKALAAFRKDNARFNSTHDCEQWGHGTMAEQLNTMEAALTSLGGESLPPPYDNVPDSDRLNMQEDWLSPAGRDAMIVDDPLASNGKAMRTSCNQKDWNIQVHEKFLRTVCRMTGLSGKWQVISYVRADAMATQGNAMQVGIYSYKVPAMCVTKTLKIEQLDPKGYTPIVVGTIDFDQDSIKVSVWAAPMDNPEEMNAIFVDRVVLIRESCPILSNPSGSAEKTLAETPTLIEWSFTKLSSSKPETLTSNDGKVVLTRMIGGAFPARFVQDAPISGEGSPIGSLSFDHGGVPPANPHFTQGALFHGALASELKGDGMLEVRVRMRGDQYWPKVYQCVASLWEKDEVGGGSSAPDSKLALSLLVFDGRWCAWEPGGIKIESRAAATPGKWQRVGVARQDGWLFLLVNGVVVGRSKCAASPAIGSVCLGGYGVWSDPKGDTPMWCMGGEMASVRIVPLTPEQGVGQISPPTYRRSLPELSASPRPASDWATLALTPLALNSILADCSTKENTKCQDANVVLASGGFGQCLDAANGGWLKYQPDYFSDSEQEVTVEAWLFLEDPTKAGTIVDLPGMYRLESRPEEKDGVLVWSLRIGGLWQSVKLPLPTKSWISVCASFDGQTMRLSAVEDGKTVQAEHLGLMARNGSALWLGAAKDGKDGFPGGIGRIRVSRNVRGADKFMATSSIPAAIKMSPVDPVPYTDSIAVARPDAIVDQMRKALPSPRMSIPLATHAPVVDGEDNDECWRSVPIESTLPITVGYEPPQRHPSRYKVETRLTRDADHLYGFMRLIAPSSDLFTIGSNSKDDYWGALKDCVELFLVPGNSTSIPYYQICFGLGGGIHDGKGRDKNWNAANLRHAVKVHGDSACVEFSIPFTDFGQTPPATGTLWRGNVFARLGGNQASWAYLWPLPDTQFHFGTMEFTAPRETEQPYVPCAVRGRLVDEKGAPVVWNIPHAAGGVGVDGHLTRTDEDGYFEIDGLVAKISTLQSFIPLCDAVAFRVELKPGMNDLGAIVQSPRRTRLPSWRATEEKSPPGAAVAWFRTWICSPPDMGKAPRAAQWANPEPEAVVAPGETEDVAAAFVALKSLENPTACIDGLKTSDGKLIPADKIRVRWVTRQLVVNGHANPPEDSRYAWKHLRDEAPDKLLKNDVAMLAITIAAPENARPGDYRGELQLRATGGMAAALTIQVTVAPFKLTEAVKQVGMYNYTVAGWDRPAIFKSKEQQREEMEDLRDHNCTLVVMCAANMDERSENSESILEACRAAGRVGMKKIAPFFSPFTNGYPWDVKRTGQRLATPGFLEKSKAFEAELDTIEKEYPRLEIIPTWGDEITLSPEPLKAWDMMCENFRSFCPDRRIYISAHPLHVGAMKSMKNQPQVLNWGIGAADNGELRSAEGMDDWGNNIKNQGYAENWCYNNFTPFSETSATRLAAGYWLWASPFDAHVPWTYYAFAGDPLNPLDGGTSDLGFAYPVFDGGKWTMIPSLQWQSWRDGYDDLRWAATLEKAIKDAKKLSEDHLAKAKALLNQLHQYDGSVNDMAAKFSPDDFTSRRLAILEAIRGLKVSH